jgi:hypothetical protein
MAFSFHRRFYNLIILIPLICTLSTACATGPGKSTASVDDSSTPAVTATAAEPTPIPTPTTAPAAVLLIAPTGADAALQPVLADLAKSSSMELLSATSLAAGDLNPSIKIVVALAPDPGLTDLAKAAASTQFVGIGMPDLKPASNLTVINGDSQQAAFIAGYIAALTTPEWRVGALTLAGDANSQALRDAFLNGAGYLCGTCHPKYGDYWGGYPTYAEATSKDDYAAAVADLKSKQVKTVYVDPALASQPVYDALASAGMQLIGERLPSESSRANWIASVQADPAAAIKAIWPSLASGKTPATSTAAVTVADVKADVLTPGRMNLINQAIQDLAAGLLGTQSVE